jgi:hypothetical protein
VHITILKPIQSNAGVNRVTTKCAMYKRPNDKLAWIDTVGWDDAHFEDDDTFKDILRFIDDNYMTSVKAIIWAVHSNVRCDGLLTSQAKLIDKFAPKEVCIVFGCLQFDIENKTKTSFIH